MNTLYIDTSKTEEVIVAIYQNGKIDKKIFHFPIGTMSDQLLTEIDKFIKSKAITTKDLSNIICYVGPGSYTSLRIGISLANALAFALNIPIFSIKEDEKLEEFIKKVPQGKEFSKPITVFYKQEI